MAGQMATALVMELMALAVLFVLALIAVNLLLLLASAWILLYAGVLPWLWWKSLDFRHGDQLLQDRAGPGRTAYGNGASGCDWQRVHQSLPRKSARTWHPRTGRCWLYRSSCFLGQQSSADDFWSCVQGIGAAKLKLLVRVRQLGRRGGRRPVWQLGAALPWQVAVMGAAAGAAGGASAPKRLFRKHHEHGNRR